MRVMRAALLAALMSLAAGAPTARVCGDPSRPCPGFKAHDLSFVLPADGKARAEAKSAPFYAVILRTVPRCGLAEPERERVQALFPRNKVFATRFECDDDLENAVTYTGVDAKVGFLAVYAGDDRAAAKKTLQAVQAAGGFPGANLRRMQVVLVSP
jgi:hypothetical protein